MLKRYVRDLLVNPVLVPAVRMLRAPTTILVAHRFELEPTGADVVTRQSLRSMLAHVRRAQYTVLTLRGLVDMLNEGMAPPRNAIVFTVDDGYADFAEIAVPVFAEFDCPVTVFITTGPVDRSTWFWWDRLTCAFENTTSQSLTITIDGDEQRYAWRHRLEAQAEAQRLADRLKLLSNAERLDEVDRVSGLLGVDTSGTPPDAYAALTWEAIRSLSSTGLVDVGPHTVTHPILSRLTPEQVHFEIHESCRRLREMYPAMIPIFAYPNGKEGDYSESVIRVIRETGCIAAVTTEQEHVMRPTNPSSRFLLPRLAMPARLDAFTQVVSGVESLKSRLRRAL